MTAPGRCGPIRSPPTARASRSAPTGGSSGSCSSTTSPASPRRALTAWSGRSTWSTPTSRRRQTPQPELHVPGLGHRDRLPAGRRPDRRVDAAARVRVQPAADRAAGAHPRPGQPGQPPGGAGRRQVPVDRPGRRGPVRHPQRAPAAPGTTNGTSAPGTSSRSRTARPPRGHVSARWRPSPASPRAATCPASG